uniref:Arf-GAP with coiled-coil, ANK repeat and PH domain-containing protein n=1 Tax=Callorhinchus milii TaxID=7868 RepID=A0A4W3IJ44_CALMI
MKLTVDFEECLKDSPRFRAAIEEVEGDVAELESKLEKVVKLCIGMIDAGKNFCNANKQFVNGIRELAQQSTKDEVIESHLMRFSESLSEMVNYHTILIDQAQRSIRTQLQTFVKEDLRKFKDAKKQFDKVSEENENALVKNAQVQRNKQHEVEEATNILTATRKCFRHIALDYVLQVRLLVSNVRNMRMLSFMYAHLAFFHQGYDLFMELEPYMKELGAQLDQLVVDAAKEKRDMEQKHSTIQQKDFSNDDPKVEYNIDAANGIIMEGYLYKRASNAFKTWNSIFYLPVCMKSLIFDPVHTSRSCMLQADSEKIRQVWIKAVQASIATAYKEKGEENYADRLDRRSSPSTSSLDSGSELKERPLKGENALQRVECIAGNGNCCDCGESDPRWASINIGITLCIECSGIHRSLGVHFSKVRSLTLDSWEPELLKVMCELGNNVINRIYEAGVEELHLKKPQPGNTRVEKETWIKAKYVDKKFVQKADKVYSPSERRTKVTSPPHNQQNELGISCEVSAKSLPKSANASKTPAVKSADGGAPNSSENKRHAVVSTPVNNSASEPEMLEGSIKNGTNKNSPVLNKVDIASPGLQLYKAACIRNLPDMAKALARGADVNWVNVEDYKATPLIQAVLGGSLVACEFLLQNGANVNSRDSHGRGPLHHATILGHTGQVCLFLKRGANQQALDEEGKDPLTIAVEAANADIVTLLRLAKMNDEMRECEGLGQSGDETYQDIFRDFSHMASNNPEILNRFQRRTEAD